LRAKMSSEFDFSHQGQISQDRSSCGAENLAAAFWSFAKRRVPGVVCTRGQAQRTPGKGGTAPRAGHRAPLPHLRRCATQAVDSAGFDRGVRKSKTRMGALRPKDGTETNRVDTTEIGGRKSSEARRDGGSFQGESLSRWCNYEMATSVQLYDRLGPSLFHELFLSFVVNALTRSKYRLPSGNHGKFNLGFKNTSDWSNIAIQGIPYTAPTRQSITEVRILPLEHCSGRPGILGRP
jgi:hypothetical protein